MRTLAELFTAADAIDALPAQAADRQIAGLVLDSRKVRSGDAFVGLAGARSDGRAHAADAAQRGASCMLVDGDATPAGTAQGDLPVVPVAGLRALLPALAAALHRDPSRRLRVLGVTGTNGKTSVTHHLAELLAGTGARAGLCGTLGVGFPGALQDTGMTTADVLTNNAALAQLAGDGAQWVAMEVSSHALDQERVAGLRFVGALMTNLSRDHLDYHGTMEAYGEAKRQLFLAPELEVACLNRDDAFARSLPARMPAAVECVDYSLRDADATLRLCERRPERVGDGRGAGSASILEIASRWGSGTVRTRLLGDFLISNLLGSITLLAGLGLPWRELLDAADVAAVPGRLQAFDHPDGFAIVVDYAHTPDALVQALSALRARFGGRLVCVFGCGGERDAGKRPLMAEAAASGADAIVVTDDNPRHEDPQTIVRDIVSGLPAGTPHAVERDRARAIRLACDGLGAGDAVLVAGKGHEDYQDGAEGRRHYSDIETVRQLVTAASAVGRSMGPGTGVGAAGA